MPQNKMAKFSEELWQIAFQNVKELFKIENLHQEQVEGIKAFFETSSHVFINLPTGFGKSMIFQSLPLIADCLYGRPRGSCTLVVISPLQALIKDQVDYLQNLSFPAISIVDDTCDDADIIQMECIHMCIYLRNVYLLQKLGGVFLLHPSFVKLLLE